MPYVIKAYGPLWLVPPNEIDGEYVKRYDKDAFDGGGDAEFSNSVDEALLFETLEQARSFAFAQPEQRPLRADGQPNRPLTAFSLEFEQVE